MKHWFVLSLSSIGLMGCVAEKLSEIGTSPKISQIQNPTLIDGYQPISMPMPGPTMHESAKGSLWKIGSKAFFKDQRARKIGDLITINVVIDNKESTSVTPGISKSSTMNSSIGNVLGLQKNLSKIFPTNFNNDKASSSGKWLDSQSNPTHSGSGKYNVEDKYKFKLASTVVQVLQNGNMVIIGRTEIKLLNEVREIEVRGIIRPSDVNSDNTIHSDKVAELRIGYTGRGDLSDVADKPWGNQIIDKIMPF